MVAAGGAEVPRVDGPNVLWYFGTVVAIGATSWLLGTRWDRFSDPLLLFVALAYLLVYSGIVLGMLRRKWLVPAGLFAAIAGLFAAMAGSTVPLVVFAFEHWTGWWPRRHPSHHIAFHESISASWVAMEIVTILVAVALALVARQPFPLAVAAFAGWYLSMDLTPAFFGREPTANQYAWTSIGVGLVMVGTGTVLDVRRLRRYAFWWHVFGLLTIAGSLCWFVVDEFEHTRWSIVTLLSALTLFLSIPFRRTTYVVFGAWGLLSSSGYWSFDAWQRSWAFPFVVSIVGVAFIVLGMLIQVRGDAWRTSFVRRVPSGTGDGV
jgi:hypothetical protein